MKKHVYIAERKKGFNFALVVNGKRERVRFVDGQFTTDDDDLAAAIDASRKSNLSISRHCRKADKEAAEKLAREHRQMLARTGAIKGGVTAEATRRAMDISLGERDLALRSQNADLDDFTKENLQMTQAVDIEATKADVAKSNEVKSPIKPVALKMNALNLPSLLKPKLADAG